MDNVINNIKMIEQVFDQEFSRCWEALRRTHPEKHKKAKKNFIRQLSAEIYGHCFMSATSEKRVPPPIEMVVNYVFHYHHFRTINCDDSERARLQKDNSYKQQLSQDIKQIVQKTMAGIICCPISTPYNPEIYTCDFLCDFFLRNIMQLTKSAPDPAQRLEKKDFVRFSVIGWLLRNAFSLIKNILGQLTRNFPSEAIITWRTLFELEYKIMVLNKYDANLANLYIEFGEFNSLEEEGAECQKEKLEKYAKHFGKKTTDIGFKNYGWILAIPDQKNLTTSLKSLLIISEQEKRYEAFMTASSFVHANPTTLPIKEHDIYAFLISQIYLTMGNLKDVFCSYCKSYNVTSDFSELSNLFKEYNVIFKQFTENFFCKAQ